MKKVPMSRHEPPMMHHSEGSAKHGEMKMPKMPTHHAGHGLSPDHKMLHSDEFHKNENLG